MGQVQSHHFADPQTGFEHQAEDGPVSPVINHGQQSLSRLVFDIPGQVSPLLHPMLFPAHWIEPIIRCGFKAQKVEKTG